MKTYISLACATLLSLLAGSLQHPLAAQQILNGSFENSSLECGVNLQNDVFNNAVPNITAFGEQSEIDLLARDTCFFGEPAEGDFLAALYNNQFSDALSFELSAPFSVNTLYRLRFAARLGEGVNNGSSRVDIGLTNDPEAFGELLFSATDLTQGWRYFDVPFEPDADDSFISVRISSVEETWVFVDDFSLNCPIIDLGNDTTLCVAEGFMLQVEEPFESLLWSDQSTADHLIVGEPGLYWVEGRLRSCVVRDSIRIEEVPFNCGCKVYIPNIFSPNQDGVNDTFQPVSPCEILDFELKIYDRWGALVYESTNATTGWDGKVKGEVPPQGVFAYQLQYRFQYEEEVQLETGSISLIR